jgi:hypothetical protein
MQKRFKTRRVWRFECRKWARRAHTTETAPAKGQKRNEPNCGALFGGSSRNIRVYLLCQFQFPTNKNSAGCSLCFGFTPNVICASTKQNTNWKIAKFMGIDWEWFQTFFSMRHFWRIDYSEPSNIPLIMCVCDV